MSKEMYSLSMDVESVRVEARNIWSYSDPDATFMHMKDDHMRNAQLKPGYNVQIGVDSEYVVGADIFQDRNDVWTLVPFTKHLEEKLEYRYPSVTADSGYESEEAYSHLAEKEITAFMEGKRLDEIDRQREIGKHPYQKVLLAIGSAAITVIICMLMNWIMDWILR